MRKCAYIFACLTPSVISEGLEQTSISPDKQSEYINKKRFCPHFLNGHQFLLRLLVELLISFPKVLVAAVNGNALGFGTALLGLCDVVYASNKVCSSLQVCSSSHNDHFFNLKKQKNNQSTFFCIFLFQATFQTCFTNWGHPPIGCCSTVLSRLLGKTGVSCRLNNFIKRCPSNP